MSTEVRVPTLNVVGWWDAENLGGALDIYDKLESLDDRAGESQFQPVSGGPVAVDDGGGVRPAPFGVADLPAVG